MSFDVGGRLKCVFVPSTRSLRSSGRSDRCSPSVSTPVHETRGPKRVLLSFDEGGRLECIFVPKTWSSRSSVTGATDGPSSRSSEHETTGPRRTMLSFDTGGRLECVVGQVTRSPRSSETGRPMVTTPTYTRIRDGRLSKYVFVLRRRRSTRVCRHLDEPVSEIVYSRWTNDYRPHRSQSPRLQVPHKGYRCPSTREVDSSVFTP